MFRQIVPRRPLMDGPPQCCLLRPPPHVQHHFRSHPCQVLPVTRLVSLSRSSSLLMIFCSSELSPGREPEPFGAIGMNGTCLSDIITGIFTPLAAAPLVGLQSVQSWPMITVHMLHPWPASSC